jgi:hypothetical protein
MADFKNRTSHWLLWWQIDPSELDEQIAGYGTFSVFKSARGISALCLCFSALLTIAFIAFKVVPPSAYVDVVLFFLLALFIYLGHRWAMIAAMLLWTAEKAIIAVSGLGSVHPNGGMLIGQFFWWTAYMHAFYLSFRVEQRRKTVVHTAAG